MRKPLNNSEVELFFEAVFGLLVVSLIFLLPFAIFAYVLFGRT